MHKPSDRLRPDQCEHEEADDSVVVDELARLDADVDTCPEVDDEEEDAEGLYDAVGVVVARATETKETH